MKITVVTVCFNAAKELEETMLSVLGQDYPDVEYIVIDGGSTDGTVDIIRKYADRLAYWVSEPDKGIYDAMNKGIAAATGDYINFMNAGDRFADSSVISNLAKNISGTPGIVYGDYYYARPYGLELCKPLPVAKMWQRIITCHQAMFFANKGSEIYYNLKYKLAGDFDLCTRIYYQYNWPLQYISVPICVYAGNGVSEHNPNNKKEIGEIASQYIPWWKRVPFFAFTNAYNDFAHWVHCTFGDKFFSAISKIKNGLIGKKKQIKE